MRIYPIFLANQGCPHRCLFCSQRHSTTSDVSLSPEGLAARLDRLLPDQGDGEIAFYGGTFTLLPEDLQNAYLDLAQQRMHAGQVTGIRLSTRPDALDSARLKRLIAAGVTTIEIGCQSFDDAVLEASGRQHTSADCVAAIQGCLDAGFKVGVQLMPGLPGADPTEAMSSLLQALEMLPDFLRIYPTVVVEATALANLWRSGEYRPFSLQQAVEVCADMLLACRCSGIPVVRLGLQQDPSLEVNLLAGPYHPAFGQLVRSQLWRRAYMALPDRRAAIDVNPYDFSDALGHGGQNRNWLESERPHQLLRADSTVPLGGLRTSGQTWMVDDLARQVNSHGS